MQGGATDGIRRAGGPDDETRPAVGAAGGAGEIVAGLIPGYRLVRRLGAGGQAVVWEGIQLSTGQRVAVKLLVAGVLAGDEARQRFRREMELVAALDHSGIVRLLDSGVTDGRPYHVLSLVDGVDVAAHVRQQRLGVREIVELVASVAEALEYAHRNRVIHRDLKPANVLVDASGHPRLVDFGAGRFDGGSADGGDGRGEDATRTRDRLLTPSHASPEQLRGEPVDTRTDVYSLGVVLHELLAGALPWPEPSSPSDVRACLEARRTPEPPSRRNRRVGRDLDTVVLRALAEDRDRRYESVAAFRRDLMHWLAGEAVEARRDSRWYVIGKAVARHRWPAAAAASALVALVAFAAVLAAGNERLQRERDRAQKAEAQARVEADVARETAEAVVDVLGVLAEGSGDATLVELLASRAFHSRADALVTDQRLRGETGAAALLQLARVASRAGDDDETMRDLALASQRCRSAPDACPDWLRLDIGLTTLAWRQRVGPTDAARDLVGALGPLADVVAPARPDLAARYHALAALQHSGEDDALALAATRRARELLASAGDARSAETALDVARALRATGRASEATRLLEGLVATDDGPRRGGPSAPWQVSAAELLADLAHDRGAELEAVALDRRAIALLRTEAGDSTARLAARLLVAGRRLAAIGRAPEAVTLLDDAARIVARVHGEESREALAVAEALLAAAELAGAAPEDLDRLRQRRRDLERAIALQHAAPAPAVDPPEDPAASPGPGRWQLRPAAPMTTARRHHAATLLADGRVLASGGQAGLPWSPTASAEVYDSVADRWTPVGDLLVPRTGHAAALLPDGRVLLAGGFSGGPMTPTDTSEVFVPDTGAFELASRLSSPRGGRPPLVVGPDGVALLLGGVVEGVMATATDAVDAFDPATGRWSSRPPLALARRGHAAASLAGGGVLLGFGTRRCCSDPGRASRARWAEVRGPDGRSRLVATSHARPGGGTAFAAVAGGVACFARDDQLECTWAAAPGEAWWTIPGVGSELQDGVGLDDRLVATLGHDSVAVVDVLSGAMAAVDLPTRGMGLRLTRLDERRVLVTGAGEAARGVTQARTAFALLRE